MKILTTFTAVLLLTASIETNAQGVMPKGFAKGSVTLSDNSVVTGFIKDNIRSKAAVILLADNGAKKETLDGDKLNAAEIEGTAYICIKGDFFKVVCSGKLSFLQKASDASSKPVYAGGEAMFINGTEGRPGDYFIYNKNLNDLKLVNNKNVSAVSAQLFVNCEAAISKAKEATADVAMLKDAVEIYNGRNK
jgi:hypothetical protein